MQLLKSKFSKFQKLLLLLAIMAAIMLIFYFFPAQRGPEKQTLPNNRSPVLYSKRGSSPPKVAGRKIFTIDELAAKSSHSLIGKIDKLESKWDKKNKVIFTYITVSVEKNLKGEPSKEVTVKKLGGTVGGVTLQIVGAADYKVGEQAVLFLTPRDIDPKSKKIKNFATVELAQGKFDIYKNDKGKKIADNSSRQSYLDNITTTFNSND